MQQPRYRHLPDGAVRCSRRSSKCAQVRLYAALWPNKPFFGKVKDVGELAAIGHTVSVHASSLATSRRREQAKAASKFRVGAAAATETSELALARTEANVNERHNPPV